MQIDYDTTLEDEISVRRLYGSSPNVIIPDEVDGKPVAGLSAYCFSPHRQTDGVIPENLTELIGDYITEVTIPDTVRIIDDLCFYGCKNLNRISIGGGQISIGSDVFMNCVSLKKIEIRASVRDKTALRQIMNQLRGETEISFEDADFLFPAFSESYELIGPAHIFELNVEGHGLRARQCFEDDVFRPGMYDRIFEKAVDNEDAVTLCKMAVCRLKSPYGMKKDITKLYQDYLISHIRDFCDELIRKRDIEPLLELVRSGSLAGEKAIRECLVIITKAGWTEGTSNLLMALSKADGS